MSREFFQIRAEIEAKILWCTTAGVSPADRDMLERLIAELEAQALAERQGKDRPPEPNVPSRPDPPRPPPAPALPKSERFHSVKLEFDRQIELLDTELEGQSLQKKQRRRLKRQRDLLASQRGETLNRLMREEAPVDLLRRHDEAEVALRVHAERTRRGLVTWQRYCEQLKQEWRYAVAQWEADPATRADQVRDHAVQRLRPQLEQLFKGRLAGPPIEKLPWRMLPPPQPGENGLAKMLTDIRTIFPGVRFEEARLEFAYHLGPVHIYVGLGEFEGYLAFLFSQTNRVLLDCPMSGNAAYIFREDWRILSRLSKTELLNYHSPEVERVIHDPDGHWRFRIRACLRF